MSNDLSEAEMRRYEEIKTIQRFLAEGYAPVQIKEMLSTTYFRIRRYATGDPLMLCRFGVKRVPETALYRSEILCFLSANVSLKRAYEEIASIGYSGKRTAFEMYCRKLIAETGITYMPKRNAAGVQVKVQNNLNKHYVTKNDVFKHIWSGIRLKPTDEDFLFKKYSRLTEINQCVQDFRKIYNETDLPLLSDFVETYSGSSVKAISSFASGLRSDFDAVKNSVVSELSNGFVEGVNNKIKVIKRMMYGRAKIDLLRVRVLFAK